MHNVVRVLIASALMFCLGCGPHNDRLPISGNVKLDGVPLDSGSIRFTSVGAEKIMASGTMIREGAYSISQEQGLRPGTYHVEITSPDSKAPQIMVHITAGDRGIPVSPERIPAEYNVDSKKTVDVTAAGANQFDFDIQRRGGKK